MVRKYHLQVKNVQEVQNLRNTEDFASESSYRIPEVQRLQLLKVVYENIGLGRYESKKCPQDISTFLFRVKKVVKTWSIPSPDFNSCILVDKTAIIILHVIKNSMIHAFVTQAMFLKRDAAEKYLSRADQYNSLQITCDDTFR